MGLFYWTWDHRDYDERYLEVGVRVSFGVLFTVLWEGKEEKGLSVSRTIRECTKTSLFIPPYFIRAPFCREVTVT